MGRPPRSAPASTMLTRRPADALTAAVVAARAELAVVAPSLAAAFADALPRAVQAVARRLVGAAYREDLAGLREPGRLSGFAGRSGGFVDGVTRHAFDRVEIRLVRDPAGVLRELPARLGGGDLAIELADAAVKMALAYARRPAPGTLDRVAALSPDDQMVQFERLSTEGHNLHPCGRTRLGWSIADALAHDLESPATTVGFVAVRRDLHVGDDLGRVVDVSAHRPGYAVQPVHGWQLDRVLRERYRGLIRAGAVVPLDGVTLTATPTAALRTLLLDPRPGHPRRYLKVSLDIQVTSTRRTISVASTRNGPALSALLHRVLAGEPRILLLTEEAGASALVGERHRDLGAIIRRGLDGLVVPGELAVPGGALYAASTGGTVLAELVDRYASTRRITARGAAASAFVDEYARLLLPPLLRLATRHGIAIEAHLQNCVPTFCHGVPHRLVLRDFAGLRLHLPRFAARGHPVTLWPGSVIGTDDVNVMRAKLAYSALQAHLGELVVGLVCTHGLDEDRAWRSVRAVIDEVYDELRSDPTVAVDAAADHAFLTAPSVPHKALVQMRLYGDGDRYVPVRNPLW
ncbi:MAG: D-ornithine---citrate ligase [Micromonosporaceae bacterium]|nr:D-ornithine---citrate ligase [Micromonosporaceae bacterium]